MDLNEKLETLVVVRGGFASLAVSSPLTSVGAHKWHWEPGRLPERFLESWRLPGRKLQKKHTPPLHRFPRKEHLAHSDNSRQRPGLNQDATRDGRVRNQLRPRLTQSFKRTGKSLWQKTHKRFRQELFAMENRMEITEEAHSLPREIRPAQ